MAALSEYRKRKIENAYIESMTIGQGVAVGMVWASAFALQGFMYWLFHLNPPSFNGNPGWEIIPLVALLHYPAFMAWAATKRIVRRYWEE